MMKLEFGDYGGQFVAETLIPALDELEALFKKSKEDQEFNKRLNELLSTFAGRPTPVYYAKNISEKYNFKLYLKREDLLYTGAHKINNTIGQALLAKYMGKNRVIAEKDLRKAYDELAKELKENETLNLPDPLLPYLLTHYDLNEESLIHILIFLDVKSSYYRVKEIHRRIETQKNGSLISIALKSYRNQHGCWPQSLDAIRDTLPEDVFVDSQTGSPFVYQPYGDTFILYGCGQDGIDDGGRYTYSYGSKRYDDVLIWPLDEEDLP